MKNMVAYCRTACASENDPGSGFRRQAEDIGRYAKCHGLVIGEMYMDAGASGVTLERPELRRLLGDCRAGRVGIVVTKDADRLSRDIGQLFTLLDAFQRAGVRVQFSTSEKANSYKFLEVVSPAVAQLSAD